MRLFMPSYRVVTINDGHVHTVGRYGRLRAAVTAARRLGRSTLALVEHKSDGIVFAADVDREWSRLKGGSPID